jgi:hypothetical protein
MWHTQERRVMCKRFLWESKKERDHLKDQGADGIRMVLGYTGRGGVDSDGARFCECSDEPSGSSATELR